MTALFGVRVESNVPTIRTLLRSSLGQRPHQLDDAWITNSALGCELSTLRA